MIWTLHAPHLGFKLLINLECKVCPGHIFAGLNLRIWTQELAPTRWARMKTPKASWLITQHPHTGPTVKEMQLPTPSLGVHGQGDSYHRRDVLGHFYPFLIIFCAFVESLDCELQKTPDDLQSLGLKLEFSLLQHFLLKENPKQRL